MIISMTMTIMKMKTKPMVADEGEANYDNEDDTLDVNEELTGRL